MTTFDPENIKLDFMNTIRTYIYPNQTSYPSSISLFANSEVMVQSFIPFSSTINTVGVYVSRVLGSPGPLTITVYSGSAIAKTGTLSGTVGWNYIGVNTADVVTVRTGSIVLNSDVDVSNDYFIGTSDTISSYYYGNLNSTVQMAFTIGIRDFVYKIFPAKVIEMNTLPVVVIDIIGRSSVEDKYLSGDYAWYTCRIRAEAISKYTQEIDKLIYGMDRAIMKIRKDFSDSYYITPSELSRLSFIRPDVYSRNITWSLKQLIARE